MASTSLKEKTKRNNLTAPFNVDLGGMIPLATVAVTSNTATITFSDIPQSYEHLQIRAIGRSTRANTNDSVAARFNGATTNYGTTGHVLYGNGTSALASSDWISGSSNYAYIGEVCGDNAGANVFGAFVTDILDYSNTNKNKTVRLLGGNDNNGSGTINLGSSFWQNTSAITSIVLTVTGNWKQYSQVSLYGIKRAGA
jgi:hypothetical protein